ncbi:hypothetical protein IVA93_31715 [Bradyrhizobium sp. 155]|uniref:hypothetical protein n=1 Tax=Bradyrhizobium sp. 155 TaxID=2782629 RepID=UPI001FFF711F|nr:hypothetical protein [Bradyrhizobium sp. 155]UPK10724.1 hypothetical protein IVA93_31715 [Bradyrhizobium sp. 155]
MRASIAAASPPAPPSRSPRSDCRGLFGGYAKRTAQSVSLAQLRDTAAHFHARYQDKTRFANLMHGEKDPAPLGVAGRPVRRTHQRRQVVSSCLVVFRYRDNIFHGNKGVESWLLYREQIRHCIESMQVLISHAEQTNPTMNDEAA